MAEEAGTNNGRARPAESGRSARKRRAILDAAREVFLVRGYDGASMDDVARLARVSKQTVYKHFSDKERLFLAVVSHDIAATETLTHDLVAALSDSDDLPSDLRRFARQHIAEVTQPHLLQLRRLIIAEAERFPELARSWYASGPERAHATLADQLAALGRRGKLRVDDPLLAAQYLNWLILSIPLNRALFHPDEAAYPREELDRYADEAVRIFLAAYGVDGP